MLATCRDAILHHLPDAQQPGSGFCFRAPGGLVGQHDLAHRQVMRGAVAEERLGGLERIGQHRGVFDDAVMAGSVLVDHETTAYRVILAASDLQACVVEGAKYHAVGVVVQRLADHRQVLLFDKRNAVFAQQVDASAVADDLQAGGNAVGVDNVRVFAFKAQQHGFVTAVAFACGAQ
ncbi:hypothetical protein D9M71_489310 [compost metagenome]